MHLAYALVGILLASVPTLASNYLQFEAVPSCFEERFGEFIREHHGDDVYVVGVISHDWTDYNSPTITIFGDISAELTHGISISQSAMLDNGSYMLCCTDFQSSSRSPEIEALSCVPSRWALAVRQFNLGTSVPSLLHVSFQYGNCWFSGNIQLRGTDLIRLSNGAYVILAEYAGWVPHLNCLWR